MDDSREDTTRSTTQRHLKVKLQDNMHLFGGITSQY